MPTAKSPATDLGPALKNALREVLYEERELFYGIIIDVVEDIGMAKAIRESQHEKAVPRDNVMRALRPRKR